MIEETVIVADIIALREQITTLLQRIEDLEQESIDRYASKAYVTEYLERMVGDLITVADKLTGTSLLKGYMPLDIERLLPKFVITKATYNTRDWRSILRSYDNAAKKANINPYLLVAQMAKEADWGRSWWSQRPRRNPAGIGVTGEVSSTAQDTTTWAFDDDQNIWKRGYSFRSWDIAASAHTGHMLAYMYKDTELSAAQGILVASDPRARFISKSNRGSVLILNDLDGKWATPGIGYGSSIATIANALRK